MWHYAERPRKGPLIFLAGLQQFNSDRTPVEP